jgi:hypothetical protein
MVTIVFASFTPNDSKFQIRQDLEKMARRATGMAFAVLLTVFAGNLSAQMVGKIDDANRVAGLPGSRSGIIHPGTVHQALRRLPWIRRFGRLRGPALVNNRALRTRSENEIKNLIRNGASRGMPPFALPERELPSLAQFIESLEAPDCGHAGGRRHRWRTVFLRQRTVRILSHGPGKGRCQRPGSFKYRSPAQIMIFRAGRPARFT